MKKSIHILCVLAVSFGIACMVNAEEPASPRKPKAIILLYGDDVGYGDVGCNGAKVIPTPHIDKLAKEGIRFTSAYSTSATCTPSRYSLLTGEYPWRRQGTGILPGNAALILPPVEKRESLPSLMKKAGYKTCAIGKWHLGLGGGKGEIDWNKHISPSPREVGFDESYIMAATADRVPCVFIKNGDVVNLDPGDPIEVSYKKNFSDLPTGKDNPEMLRVKPSLGHNQSIVDGIPRIGYMRGGKSALWKDQDLADTLTKQAIEFIEQNKDKPFFIYFATNDIHVPRDPHQRFIGKSGCGIRGDVTVQMDDCMGRVLEALDKAGLREDSLIIFSSDNGPVVDDGYQDFAKRDLNGHKPAGPLNGGKCSVLEGGTRLPFIVCWPGQIKPGVSQSIVSQMDIAPTLAALTGQEIRKGSFPDARNMLPAFFDASAKGRDEIVTHGMQLQLGLRQGNWKYYPAGTINGNKEATESLFDLGKDPGEKNNLAQENQDIVKKMAARLKEIVGTPRQPLIQ